jgi:hypothetical protein
MLTLFYSTFFNIEKNTYASAMIITISITALNMLNTKDAVTIANTTATIRMSRSCIPDFMLWIDGVLCLNIKRNVGLVRFELTIDGSLRTLEEFKENTNQCSNGSSLTRSVEQVSVDPLLIILSAGARRHS